MLEADSVHTGTTWGQHGVNLGSTWGQPGFNPGSTWGQLGVNLQPPTIAYRSARVMASRAPAMSPVAFKQFPLCTKVDEKIALSCSAFV